MNILHELAALLHFLYIINICTIHLTE